MGGDAIAAAPTGTLPLPVLPPLLREDTEWWVRASPREGGGWGFSPRRMLLLLLWLRIRSCWLATSENAWWEEEEEEEVGGPGEEGGGGVRRGTG